MYRQSNLNIATSRLRRRTFAIRRYTPKRSGGAQRKHSTAIAVWFCSEFVPHKALWTSRPKRNHSFSINLVILTTVSCILIWFFKLYYQSKIFCIYRAPVLLEFAPHIIGNISYKDIVITNQNIYLGETSKVSHRINIKYFDIFMAKIDKSDINISDTDKEKLHSLIRNEVSI